MRRLTSDQPETEFLESLRPLIDRAMGRLREQLKQMGVAVISDWAFTFPSCNGDNNCFCHENEKYMDRRHNRDGDCLICGPENDVGYERIHYQDALEALQS